MENKMDIDNWGCKSMKTLQDLLPGRLFPIFWGCHMSCMVSGPTCLLFSDVELPEEWRFSYRTLYRTIAKVKTTFWIRLQQYVSTFSTIEANIRPVWRFKEDIWVVLHFMNKSFIPLYIIWLIIKLKKSIH